MTPASALPSNISSSRLDLETELEELIASCYGDPLRYVRLAFDWGKGELEGESGPDDWQIEVLNEIGKGQRRQETALQIAVSSGHGIGKGALSAWIILWSCSTRPHLASVVTANTKTQLDTKTWRELAVWHHRAINAHWFDYTATRFCYRRHPDTWGVDAIAWNKDRAEAFAGLHSEHVLVIYDEASAIDDVIWETTEGAMTQTEALWFAFGNPTRNSGRFRECFGKFKHRWITHQIDSRNAKKANHKKIEQWIEDYGEDSDFCRVRVRGVFPRAGSNQLISSELVYNAQCREAIGFEMLGKVLGVDIARHGANQTVILRRQGQRVWKPKRLRIADLMQVAARVAEDIDAWDPDATFLDVTGMGWGVYDCLRALGYGERVVPVQTGEAATRPEVYYNRRAELWDLMREWLVNGGCLPSEREDVEIADELSGLEYGFDAKQRLKLETKEDMQARDLSSPDGADALALTFFAPVRPRNLVSSGTSVFDRPTDWRI